MQTVGMFGNVEAFPEARPVLQALEGVLDSSLAEIEQLPASELHKNHIAQPLICAFELAVWAILSPRLPTPRAFAGYSVGELAAHGCAGTLSPSATIKLASERARLMDECCRAPCAMIAVRGLSRDAIEHVTHAHGAAVAIINGRDRFVLGGRLQEIDAVAAAVAEGGAAVTRLHVHVPSHTPLVVEASRAFAERLAAEPMTAPTVCVLSGLDGQPVATATRARQVLSAQISNTIDWSACLDGLAEQGCRVLLELGCGSDLTRMARDTLPDICARSIADFRSIDAALAWVERVLSE